MSTLIEGSAASTPLDYYTNLKNNYDAPWLTDESKRNMVGCMHPSCECRNQQRNKIQTPGGGYGVMTDRQIARIVEASEVLDEKAAVDLDLSERNTSELDIHEGCAYWRLRTGIVGEMADPSSATLRTLERWRQEIYFKNGITKDLMDEVIGSAGVLLRTLPEGEQSDSPKLMNHFNERYPGKNVHPVEPIENPVGLYVVSHLVNVVQNQKHRKHPETPMAYFDSLGALINLTLNHGDDRDPQTATLMNASSMLRSASARTYIASAHPIDLLEVRRTGKEVIFEEVEL